MLSATAQRSSSNLTIENRESSSHMKSPSLLNYLGSISSPPGWRRSFSTISIGDDIKTLVSSKTEHKETPSGPEKPVKKLTFVQKIFRKGVKTVLSNLITYKRSKSNYKTMYERWQHEKIEWGIICILSGFIQSILVGCIESYILWSVYKFTMLSWGDYKGSSQFILTYMSLFICAQFVFTFLLVDAAWKKNSLQVGVSSLKACSTSFLAVYAATPTPSIYTNTATQTTPFQAPNASLSTLYLSNANGSVYFDLMADCPWTIDDRTVKRLTDSLNLISVTDSFQSAILALCVIGCFCSLMFGWKAISEYKWKIFELQGASLRRRYMILRYHFFLVLIKINLFFMFSIVTMIVSASYYSAEQQSNKYAVLSAQYYFYSSQSPGYLIPQSMIPSFASTAPFSTTLIPSLIVTLFVAIILFALGWHAIHRTNVAAMVVFLFFIVGDLAAVGYVINLVNTNSSFDSTRLIVMLLAYIQCITDICILCTGIMSIRDFNQGLKIMLNAQKILATSDPDLFQRAKPRTKAVLD
ncbi:hypothetical protein BC830DRAFT_510731 [Chytriomyces sp. MP71]|nr:hypothetical protein BC830DRAFT_510731 [Chytriomyces sp. MP71]